MQWIIVRVDLCCFDENNHFLTEIEAGSTKKFLVIRFSVDEMMPPDVISHENQLQHLSEPSIFILDVFRTADHAGQIFIPHRPWWIGLKSNGSKPFPTRGPLEQIFLGSRT